MGTKCHQRKIYCFYYLIPPKITTALIPFYSGSSSVHHSISAFCPPLLLFCPGSKAAPRPGGIGSAAAGQPGMEGDNVFSKILPGGAAEQAGKLGEGTINKNHR